MATSPETHDRSFPFGAAFAVTVVVFACAAWASLAFAVTDPRDFVYFPPFEAGLNHNGSDHLGGEYFNIARSLAAGDGFSSPFNERTGPTAWMPPLLPAYYVVLLWIGGGDKDCVTAGAVLLQVIALVATGILVAALAQQVTRWIGAGVAAAVFLAAMLLDFHAWFQFTHDYAFILLAADLLIAGLVWCRPLANRKSAALWGVFGGMLALAHPILGVVWAVLTLPLAWRQRAFMPMGIALLTAGLTLTPWTVRNLLVLGRLIPIKSNAGYELYQSQCLQKDGLLQNSTFATHPYSAAGSERRQYAALGEIEFIDRKTAIFWKSVWADPLDFCDRVACRFFGVTLWYIPNDRHEETRRPVKTWLYRLVYPLPFLGLLVLALTAFWRPLSWVEGVLIGVYLLYFAPYIALSYYDRYGLPMLGVKTLLVVCAADRLLSLAFPRRPVAPRPRPTSP